MRNRGAIQLVNEFRIGPKLVSVLTHPEAKLRDKAFCALSIILDGNHVNDVLGLEGLRKFSALLDHSDNRISGVLIIQELIQMSFWPNN